MFKFLRDAFAKVKQTAQTIWSDVNARKEMLIDAVVVSPYIIADTLLYWGSFLEILRYMAKNPDHPEKEDWFNAAYYIGASVNVLLAGALFLAFSNTVNKLMKIPENEYQKMKYQARRIIGLPGSTTKVVTGELSLYLYLVSQLDRRVAIGITTLCGVMAMPAITSFLWSNHTTEQSNDIILSTAEERTLIAKKAFAYITSLCYSTAVGFVSFPSALRIGKNMGLIDHDFSQFQNRGEEAIYIMICVGAVIETAAVFLAFARLNANMFGLIKDESNGEGCWPKIEESKIKKGMGGFAVCFKILNIAASAFHFFRSKLPLGANIFLVSYSSLSGICAEGSVLVADPLGNTHTDNTNNTYRSIEDANRQAEDLAIDIHEENNDVTAENVEKKSKGDLLKYFPCLSLFATAEEQPNNAANTNATDLRPVDSLKL